MRTLLMTSCGGAAGLSALDLLSSIRSSFTLIAADSNPISYAREIADEFVQFPPTKGHSAYAAALLQAIDRFQVNATIPCHSSELQLYAELGAELSSRRVRWPSVTLATARTVSDKLMLYATLRREGISVPDFATLEEPFAGRKRVIKLRTGAGGNGCLVLDRSEPIPDNIRAMQNRYLQQVYAEGEEISLDGVVLSDSRIFGPVCRIRRETRYGLAFVSDAIDLGATGKSLFRSVAMAAGTSGPLNVQVFRNRDGALSVTDVNPRFPAGGLALSAALGLNIPNLVATDLLLGPSNISVPVIEFRPVRHYKLFADRIV